MRDMEWHAVGPTSDVTEAAVTLRTFGRRSVLLVRIQGEIRAFDGMCPHAGGPLARGDVIGTVLTCPLHGWRFDLGNAGRETHGFADLRSLPTRIDGDRLFVQL